MRITARLIGAMLLSFTALKAGTIELPLYGFKIDALDGPVASIQNQAVLVLFLPETEGFVPSVNVMIRSYEQGIEPYIALSKAELADKKLSIISETQIPDGWIVEYAGRLLDQSLHFYAKALSKPGKIYLVTATAKESQWGSVGDALRQSVDSFETR